MTLLKVSSVRFSYWCQQSTAYIIRDWAVLREMVKTGSCNFLHPSSGSRPSYFNESDLELTASDLGHLDEEGRLIGVVFDDVVVHVDENPAETHGGKKRKVNPR